MESLVHTAEMPGSRPLFADEHRFNAYMAKQRMAVEWGFGKIMQLFQFCNLKVSRPSL
jgi:hypothetical protein